MTSLDYKRNSRIVHPIELQDALGNLIIPGTILAYPSGTKLKFGVYEGVVKCIVSWSKVSYKYRIYLATYSNNKVRSNLTGYLEIDKTTKEFLPAENFVVIKNPLYHLNNLKLRSLLLVIDKLKDEGILSKNFKIT